MSVHVQLYRARRDHARFGLLVRLEQARPRPDPARLADLKKRRLLAKDRIARLEALADAGPAYA
jgi:hypothetical protein